MTLQRLLGIELPIIRAPMAGVQGSALAVAVSNAGGLGSLPCAMLAPTPRDSSHSASSRVIAAGGIADSKGVAAIAPLRAKAEREGSGNFSPMWSGQNASGCKEIPAAALTRAVAAEL